MILKFPDLDTLKLVLINGVVPSPVALAPATAGTDDKEQVWIDTSSTIPKKALDELKKYGVEKATKNGAELAADVTCWLEMLPLVPETESVLPDQTPVLFDLPDGEQFKWLANEILRLGNDRQSFRWLEEKGGGSRALLRVIGPPYYSLLRALDAKGPQAPRAFVERGHRVWVQMGWTHPLAKSIKAPEGQLLLLRPPRQWTYLPDQPLDDIYKIIDFKLPGMAQGYKDSELKDRLKVSLKLTHGNVSEPAELWVLRDDPIAELNALVQDTNDEILARLSFAVGDTKDRQTIVLMVRPSKQPPPILTLKATAFRNYWKLPNLYLPVGWGLHPPLRRDIVRKLLAEDTALLTWLYPEDKQGRFTPERISRDAFRPLTEWVDYVIDHEAAALQTWVQSHQFDFESFLCDEDGPPRPKKGPSEKVRNAGRGGSFQPFDIPLPKEGDGEGKSVKMTSIDEGQLLVPSEPTAQQIRLRELEEKFVLLEGSLDIPERLAMWPELAQLNSVLNNADDAGICWTNALWNSEEWPESHLWTWFRTEARTVPSRPEKGKRQPHSWVAASIAQEKPREVSGEDLDRVLAFSPPNYSDMRALSAYIVWASRRATPPADLVKRLIAIGRFLETHEDMLSARATWLVWLAFVRLTNGDVLALARARDRLLERFFEFGLRPERDLPQFLRQSGQPGTQRFRNVRQWMLGLCDLACEWSKEANATSPNEGAAPTLAYIKLLFAYGMARLGELDASREKVEAAQKEIVKAVEEARKSAKPEEKAFAGDAHRFLFEAFCHRIKLVQNGSKNAGPLPSERMDYLQNKMEKMQRYVVDRFRQHSRILEPEEKIDPYAEWGARVDELSTKLAAIVKLSDRREIADRLSKMLREVPKSSKGHEQRARILRTCMDVAPRVSEEFANESLAQFAETWDSLPDAGEIGALIERAELLERGLFVAVHFDRKDHVPLLVSRFQKLLHTQRGSTQAMDAIEKLGRESLRGLRKLGMRDEIDTLLRQMENVILNGQEPSSLVTFSADRNGPVAMKALLHVASGWLFFNRERQAEPTIKAARALLYSDEWPPTKIKERATLANVYARTIGGASVDVVKTRLEELFHTLNNIRDTLTTSKHYSLLQLDIVESVVLAIAGDDQTLGVGARRWLDDDEFIVRRRIHRDYQTARAKG